MAAETELHAILTPDQYHGLVAEVTGDLFEGLAFGSTLTQHRFQVEMDPVPLPWIKNGQRQAIGRQDNHEVSGVIKYTDVRDQSGKTRIEQHISPPELSDDTSTSMIDVLHNLAGISGATSGELAARSLTNGRYHNGLTVSVRRNHRLPVENSPDATFYVVEFDADPTKLDGGSEEAETLARDMARMFGVELIGSEEWKPVISELVKTVIGERPRYTYSPDGLAETSRVLHEYFDAMDVDLDSAPE